MNALTLSRKGESKASQNRSERVFIQHNYWSLELAKAWSSAPMTAG